MTDPIRRFGDFLIQQGLVTEGQVQEALALQPLTGSRVGEALLSLGYLTRGQLQRALSQAVQKGDAVVLDRPPLGAGETAQGPMAAAIGNAVRRALGSQSGGEDGGRPYHLQGRTTY